MSVFKIATNDADYPVVVKKKIVCPYYRRWFGMLSRAYSKNFHKNNPAYIGCTVCDEWLLFSRFKKWMEAQDWQGMELDKDILFPGNKIYSPDKCCFVDKATNNLFTGRAERNWAYLRGVTWNKRRSCYVAQGKNGEGKLEYLGGYRTEKNAHSAYLLHKAKIVRSVAYRQTDPRVFIALSERAAIMEMEPKPDKI